MKKLVLMLTVLALSVPFAAARDLNWEALKQSWNAQQKEQRAAEKKAAADQAQKDVTVKVYKPGSEPAKTK